MMIDYNFFGYKFHGNVWDTAIPTSHIDEVVIGAGIYDEIYVSGDAHIDRFNLADFDTAGLKFKIIGRPAKKINTNSERK